MPDLRKSYILKFIALAAALIAVILFGLAFGAAKLPLKELFESAIFMQVRLPRVAAGLFCGAALAAAGLLTQTLLGNHLASPTLIGVNSGAGFAIALSGVLSLRRAFLPPVAFFGAVLASMLIYLVSLRKGSRKNTLLLAGVAISGILSAGIDSLHSFFPSALPGYGGFMLGSFGSVGWDRFFPACVYIAAGLFAAGLLCAPLDVFALGDETAHSFGLPVNFVRGAAFLTSSALAGAAVSICGLLGFVGLMSPHLARAVFRTARHSVLLPASVFMGSVLVLLCDTLGRTLFSPYELPAGIALSLIGGPFFLFLLLRRKRYARV